MDEELEANLILQQEEISTLQSIYDNDLRVIQSPQIEGIPTETTIQITVNLTLDSPIDMKVYCYYSNLESNSGNQVEEGASKLNNGDSKLTPSNQPALNYVLSEHAISHIPPICIQFRLSNKYPSQAPPQYAFISDWLDLSVLNCIYTEMDSLWVPGMGVLFSWVDWLNTSLSSYIDLDKNGLILKSNQFVSNDARLQRTVDCLEILVPRILTYNIEQLELNFLNSELFCDLCYEDKLGLEFYRLPDCPHMYCKECLTDYCKMHIKDGTVQQLCCPSKSCDVSIHPSIITLSVGEEEFQRWDRLMLQRTIEGMDDLQYCPRCIYPAECDKTSKQCICASCYFVFCMICKEPYHFGACKDSVAAINLELDKLKKSTHLSQKEIELKREQLKQLRLSETFMKTTSRNCPNCNIPIHKTDGCNKMTCSQCSTCFCYLCGARGSYEHFQTSKCQLFAIPSHLLAQDPVNPQQPPLAFINFQEALEINRNAPRIRCPNCGQENAKFNNNNHIRCWSCNGNICFTCRTKIIGPIGKHFKGKCPQHS